MNNSYKKYDNETFSSYVRRMVEMQCEDNFIGSHSDWMNLVFGINHSEDVARREYYGVKMLMEKISDELINGFEEEDMVEYLEQMKDRIYIDRYKLSSENREKNKYLREQSKIEMLIEELRYSIQNLDSIKFNKCEYHYGKNVEASLLVSDSHYGSVVDNIFNYYDDEIIIEKLSQLKAKTVKLCKLHKVDCLHVELLGDLISGIIHGGTISENNRDIMSQVTEVSEIFSTFIRDLAEEIPEVKVYTVFGNHGRSTSRKSDSPNKENFERLVGEFIKLRLPEIKVLDSKYEDFIFTTIKGKNIVMTHGDKDSVGNVSGNFHKLFKGQIDEVHMAHLHAHQELDDNNTQIVVNGSIMGTDGFAVSIRKNNDACQLLRIYDEDICCYRLKLD